MRVSLLLIAIGALPLVGCAPQLIEPTVAPPPARADISFVSSDGGGRLPTRVVPPSPTVTPTTDIVAVLVTVVPFPTRTPGPAATPTPTMAPPLTSTPRNTPTRPSGSFAMLPTPTPRRLPTRTPAPRSEVEPVEPEPASFPTETPIDVNEPNNSAGQATVLDEFPTEGWIDGPDDVDVYAVTVTEANTTLVVTLTGQFANRYKVDIVAPRSGPASHQRLDGSVTVRATAYVGAKTGTYLVFVRGLGADFPQVPYFISAESSGATATPTRRR